MLFRRTCKLVEFENATKALEKAKPKNQEAVSYTLTTISSLQFPPCFKPRLRIRTPSPEKKNQNVVITQKTHQMFCVHSTPESFWKHNNHRSCWICVWGRQGNHVIVVTSSFSKSSVFKTFSVHPKTKSRCFQIPSVWKAFSKSVFAKLRFHER